ncbi:hypothetical protein V500_01813, partial [Pseudogymnoascus sp. VKM F-4518 (FW-2643)]
MLLIINLLPPQLLHPAKREQQCLVAHKPHDAVLAREHDLLQQAGRRAPVIRGRGDVLGESHSVEERAIYAPAQDVAHVEDGVAKEGDVL